VVGSADKDARLIPTYIYLIDRRIGILPTTCVLSMY